MKPANPTRFSTSLATLLASLAALASCSVGPAYVRPDAQAPAGFKSAATQPATEPASTQISRAWWELFDDPTLTTLEGKALTANFDLKAAMSRVAQARASARIAESQFYPTITLDPSVERTRSSAHGPGGGSRTYTDYKIPFDLTYEVDIWGKLRHASNASNFLVQASADDYEVVRQTLAADVALNYFAIRSLDAQNRVLLETVDSYRRQATLIEQQMKSGLVSRVDLAQAKTQLSTAIAQEADIRRQRADIEHTLAILLGGAPSDFALESNALSTQLPQVPVGLPADILLRRPDVAQAERNLAAANEQIGVATAQFYPTVRLTGVAGFESIDIEHVVDWESRIWSLGPSVTFPIFEGGKLKANLAVDKARYDELVSVYRASVLTAFREVEDALTDLHLRSDQSLAQNDAVGSAREYLGLVTVQYKKGLVNYLVVIDAERTLLANELASISLHNQRLTSTVYLIKALGGGWDATTVTAPSTHP